MLRNLRPWRRFGAVLLTAAAWMGLGVEAQADQSFEAPSTFDAQIAPQDLSLDAAINSMVRRGLLADLTVPAKALPGRKPARPTPRPIISLDTGGQWRPRSGVTSTPDVAAPRRSDATGWRPLGRPLPPPQGVSGTGDAWPELTSPAEHPDSPALVAERVVEPETSDDPLPDEHLAPIDDLSETPAPADDAPGDPREPEFGDEDLDGVLLPPSAGRPADDSARTPGGGSSLSRRSLTPVGEPDRIETPDARVDLPSEPNSLLDSDDGAVTPTRRRLTRNQMALREKVRRVLKYYYANPLNTGNRSPWEVMHCMLSFEVHSRVLKGGPQGEPITAVGWLCFNQPCKGRTLMYLNQDGAMRVKVGPALQGHHGQLLALLAQARVRADYPMRVEGKDFTVADLIEEEKATCYPRTELTFKLIGLQRYLDLDAKWMNDQGMAWDFPTLLREEMRQPVRTAACGGTHRLSGLMLTVKRRQRSGKPVDGEYAAAQRFVANYMNYAFRLQNSDGSFSTEWFKGPGAEEDIDRRLKTTGHQLEFLIYSSTEQQLTNYRLVKAVNYLSNIMWANRGRDWEAGPLGHAIHSLVLYDRLVFAPHDGEATGPVARDGRQKQR